MNNIIRWLLIICFLSTNNLYAKEGQSASAKEQVVVNAKWGNKNGEIGTVPLNPEDQTAGESINPLALDKNGNIYIGDSVNSRIIKFNSKGDPIFEFKFPPDFYLIEDIFVDESNRVYALTEQAKLNIIICNANGAIESIIDISKIGQLEKNKDGKTVLNKGVSFAKGVRDRLFVNADGTIFILGSDLVKINKAGEVINRVGPYADNFFVDSSGVVYVLFIYGRGGEVEQYDRELKHVKIGWGKYKDILWPEKSDSFGNVYGFGTAKEYQDNLLKFNTQSKKYYKLPLTRDHLELERWTVDRQGNIYYTISSGDSFKVLKLILLNK